MSVLPAIDPKTLDAEDAALLAELEQALEANPLLGYNHPDLPKRHEKQMEFNAIKAPPLGTKAMIAGSRTGKTRGGLADDVIQAVRSEFIPPHLEHCKKWQPPFHVWIGAPKYSKHEDTILPTLRKLIPKGELIEGSFNKSYKAQSRMLRLVSGSTFGCKTYDQDLDAWASAEVHRIHWDEEPNGENGPAMRSEARARLLSTEGDELISMTPLLGFSWVNNDVWEERHTNPKVIVRQMGMKDNPWLTAKAIADYERGLTEDEIRMRVHGEFVHLGGMFFEEFDERLHVIGPIQPDHLKYHDVVIGLDPGRTRTGVVWVSFDKDNSALVFDEWNPGRDFIVSSIAEEIHRRNEFWGIKEPTYVIDPSSRNEQITDKDEVAAAYSRHGINCEWGKNPRGPGITEMKRRLQAKDAKGLPSPTLLYTRDCHETIKQHERYRRDPKARDEWQAIPQNDQTRFDLVDATRYAVMSRTYDFMEPGELPKDPPHYDPVYEPPYDPGEFLIDPAPMGDWA